MQIALPALLQPACVATALCTFQYAPNPFFACEGAAAAPTSAPTCSRWACWACQAGAATAALELWTMRPWTSATASSGLQRSCPAGRV